MPIGKILFVSDLAGFAGGIERYIHQTAALLNRQGFSVYGLFGNPSREHEQFIEPFEQIWSYQEVATIKMDFALVTVHKVTDPEFFELLCGYYQVTLFVHDHDCYCPRRYKYFPVGRRNCSLPYRRIFCGLCSLASSPRHWRQGLTNELIDKFVRFPQAFRTLRRCHRMVVLSKFMRDNLVANGIAVEKVFVLHPAVALPPPAEPREDHANTRLIFTGQLIRGKGADLLLQALARLREPFSAEFVGDGNDAAMLHRLAEQLHLTDKVEFTGWLTQPELRFATSDIAVLPFRWQEPFGLVGLEAMAHALPVVAFDVGGCREWLHDGNNGILVPAGDISQLAKALDELIASPQRGRAMGKYGRNLAAEQFSESKLVGGFQWLLENQSENLQGTLGT